MRQIFLLIGIAGVLLVSAGSARAQTTGTPVPAWTRVLAENYSTPDTVLVTVPATSTVTVRWGSGTTFVTRTLPSGTSTFLAGNSTFGDPTPGVAKELDVEGTGNLADFQVNGRQLTNPAPTLTDLTVTPAVITATTGTVVQTRVTCTFSDGSTTDCTAQASFTFVRGGVTAYTGAGAILGTEAGPAEVDVSLNALTARLSITVVDLPIYFNGGVIASH